MTKAIGPFFLSSNTSQQLTREASARHFEIFADFKSCLQFKEINWKILFNDLSKFYNINNCNFCFLSNRQFWIERAGLKAREIPFRIEGIISLLHHCSSTIPTKTYPLSLTDRTFESRAPFEGKCAGKYTLSVTLFILLHHPSDKTSLQ